MSDPHANTYHNAHTEILSTETPEMRQFLDATDGVLAQAAELARVVASAHQGAATQMIGGDWSHARKYFSLSEKYAAWAEYRVPAVGSGIHAYIAQVNRPVRLTQTELEAHPAWKGFGAEQGRHPPMRGWLAVPLIGADGLNYGLIQVSDRYSGDFTEEDEANMARLARLTSQALDALAMVYFPDYREHWALEKSSD
jgi:GAF domain-containing protein